MTPALPGEESSTGSFPGLTWRALRLQAQSILAEAGIESPQADARWLAEHVAETSLITAPEPTDRQAKEYENLVAKRAARIPLQHLTGTMYFRNLVLPAEPGVFIVRPETELVAGKAIEAATKAGPSPLVVDLCTGSGAIAISIADEVPGARVVAVELDDVAVEAASRNAMPYGVEVRHGDARTACDDLLGQVDVVVSNPPYVPPSEVPPEVGQDPSRALWGGGEDGLEIPRALVARARQLLKPGGVLVMEHDENQGEALVECARELGMTGRTEPDLAGRPRFLYAV
ncbi:MAG: peptide chain release factor N(5)-glutamine methyltransferase [Flaviflexus sp.]|uniref:peptide chain release factor N(5)-glutamine methyltransferase n=1 Tax=Flaviflexus sp. TaxID=1969482 RepID=UPI003F8EE701